MVPRFQSMLLCALAASFSSCSSSPRKTAEKKLKRIGAERVRAEAAVFYKNMFAGVSTTFVTIKTEDCPATFRMFNPQYVVGYRDGFSLALERGPSGESGLHIVPSQMDVLPSSGQGARFERIADGIYWYSFRR